MTNDEQQLISNICTEILKQKDTLEYSFDGDEIRFEVNGERIDINKEGHTVWICSLARSIGPLPDTSIEWEQIDNIYKYFKIKQAARIKEMQDRKIKNMFDKFPSPKPILEDVTKGPYR